jgi:hypothetical protein
MPPVGIEPTTFGLKDALWQVFDVSAGLSGSLSSGFRARFSGQIADAVAVAQPPEAPQFELEGPPFVVVETGHIDTLDTTSLYVPGPRPGCLG